MKRLSTFAALLALLTLLALPAMADGEAALPSADGCQDPLMSTPLDLQPPDATYAGPCSVYRYCDDGSQISCNGQSACSSGPGNGGGWVECDGNRTWCPYDPNCTAGNLCKTSSQCYCYDFLCACVDRHCVCLSE